MYAVSIRYPRRAGDSFDFDHWARVHMPLGVATFEAHNGIAPCEVRVQHATFGMDGTAESADSYITVWLLFETRAGLDGFMSLHNDAEASADLSQDFDNYAPSPPSIVLGEVAVFDDMTAVLEQGRKLMTSGKQEP